MHSHLNSQSGSQPQMRETWFPIFVYKSSLHQNPPKQNIKDKIQQINENLSPQGSGEINTKTLTSKINEKYKMIIPGKTPIII